MQHLLFAYGTLRRGEPNSHLLQQAEACGSHLTAPRYTMYNLGDYPGVIEGGSSAISGEVYRINPQQLEQLDLLEEYPTLYGRKQIPTPWGLAWIYLYNDRVDRAQVIACGDWTRRHRQA
jgi:gamma-glutamylcyclotransferase (GGCT)/AIG2-like uncharacterized protein YtfP